MRSTSFGVPSRARSKAQLEGVSGRLSEHPKLNPKAISPKHYKNPKPYINFKL